MANELDYSTLTVTSTAQTISTSCDPVMPSKAKGAYMTIETDQIRVRDDGTEPTSTEGHLLNPGDSITYDSWSRNIDWVSVMSKLQVIRVTGDASLKISWFD